MSAETSRSFRLPEFGQPLEEHCEAIPVPTGSEVIVRVRGAGVCHTDLHLQDGHYDLGSGEKLSFRQRVSFPVTPGHETAGDVVALGADATGLAPGEAVLVCAWVGCGRCDRCRDGQDNLCATPAFLGVNRNGGYSDHIVVPHPKYLVPLGDIDPVQAAPLACSGLTCYSAIRKFGSSLATQPLVLIGAGGLGLMAVGLLDKLGMQAPVVVEIDPAKRAAALKAGAKAAIDPLDAAADDLIRQAVGGPITAILDMVGAGATFDMSMRLAEKAGHIVIVGLLGGDSRLSVPLIPMRALKIEGSYVGSPGELHELVALLRETGLPDTPVHCRPLAEANESLDALRHGKVVGRVVLVP